MTTETLRTRGAASPDIPGDPAGWDELRAIVANEGDVLASHARLVNMRPGDVSPERAAHTGLRALGTGSGDVDDHSPAPDAFAWERSPEVRVTRSSKGRRSFVVTGAHATHRIGADPFRDVDEDGRTLDTDERGRPNLYRWDGRTLATMADAWARQHGYDLEPVAGLELSGRMFSSLTDTGGDDRDAGLLARHRTDLSGGFGNLARIVVHSSERADHKYRATHSPTLGNTLADAIGPVQRPAGSVKRRGWRIKLGTLRARQSDPVGSETALLAPGDRVAVRVALIDQSDPERFYRDGTPVPRRIRTAVRTAVTETLFVGHEAKARTPVKRASGATREAARAIVRKRAAKAAAAIVATPAGEAIATAPDGVRAVLDLDGVRLTFTPRAGRVVTYRWQRGDRSGRFTARTPVAAALRLATIG